MSPMKQRVPAWVCTRCRLLLRDDVCVRGSDHEVFSLSDPHTRAALMTMLWPGTERPPRLTGAAKMRIAALVTIGLLIWASTSEYVARIATYVNTAESWLPLLFLPTVWPLATVALWLMGGGAEHLTRLSARLQKALKLPARTIPTGVGSVLPEANTTQPQTRVHTGVVRALEPMPAPLSGRPCVAYMASLCTRKSSDGPILVGELLTTAFMIACDEGGQVIVPAGSLWLDSGHVESFTVSRAEVDAYIAARGRVLKRSRFLPYDYADEAILQHGDRVILTGQFKPLAAGYRNAPRRQMVGIAHVRRL